MASQEPKTIIIDLSGYEMSDVKELEQLLRAEPGVLDIQRRFSVKDGLYEHRDINQIAMHVKLVIEYVAGTAVGSAIGRLAADIFKDRVIQWLNDRKEGNKEVDLLLGPDGNPVVKIKKKDLK